MDEYHTSELTASCPRQAQLRLEGKEVRTAETALFRGLLGHSVLEEIHTAGNFDSADLHWESVAAKLDAEGRTISPAVIDNRDDIVAEVDGLCAAYVRRVMPLIEETIGVELPVSLTIDVDGDPVRFASHIDAVVIMADPFTGERSAAILDWKFRQDEPSMAYLVRNLQLGMYQFALWRGGVLLDGWPWTVPDYLPLRCYWVHMPNLRPYGRKVTTKDSNGDEREYKRGDDRPIRRVLIEASCNDDGAVYAAFAERVKMRRFGLAPAIPDPVGCRLCLSQYACNAWGNYA